MIIRVNIDNYLSCNILVMHFFYMLALTYFTKCEPYCNV